MSKQSALKQAVKRTFDRLFIKQPRVRRLVTKLAYGNGLKKITLLGTEYVVDTVRENGYLRASRLSSRSQFLSHELDVLNVCCVIAAEVDYFLDVGANVGTVAGTVAQTLRYCGKLTKVIAFEAHPNTFIRLKINAAAIGFDAYNCALSDCPRELDFVDGAVSHVFTTFENASGYNIKSEVIRVEANTLDAVSPPHGTIALKIDVEGQEAEVVHGARALLEARRIKHIYFDGLKDYALLAELASHGFECSDMTSGGPATDKSFRIIASLKP